MLINLGRGGASKNMLQANSRIYAAMLQATASVDNVQKHKLLQAKVAKTMVPKNIIAGLFRNLLEAIMSRVGCSDPTI